LLRPKTQTTQATEAYADAGPRTVGSFVATEIDGSRPDATQSGDEGFGIDRTVPGMRTPYGEIGGGVQEPEAMSGHADEIDPTEQQDEPDSLSDPTPPPVASRASARPLPPAKKGRSAKKPGRGRSAGRVAGCLGTTAMGGVGIALLVALAGAGVAGGGYWYYSQDLPSVEALRAYEPPTVTVVKDATGETLGEIFDERRYVVPVDQIPKHVKDAFVAAEDANFWNHGGIDYAGIMRAILRNAAQGRMAQGASTITQQVARNFLLTRDKKLERKIKEVILSWRIEDTYSKEHILYLYLNEIFLGNQAYGVEAASRAYFGKSVKDVTLAEAAILAGLPQRPSDYAPNKHFDKAKERQEYVLEQMVEKGFITEAERKAALAEVVKIAPPENAFREQAPWFTEHVRRYLVDKYGEDAVLRQGLQVTTTCRLDLQKVAQDAVTRGAEEADERIGFRRAGIEHLASAAEIQKHRDTQESDLRAAEAYLADPAGRKPLPAHSTLVVGERYPAVVLEVNPKWARIGIGEHEGVIPIAWADWVYDPDPNRSWRGRAAADLTDTVDVDGDHKPDGQLIQVGDVVHVEVGGLDTTDPALASLFANTPGAAKKLVAAKIYQDPEIESALLSMDLSSGAVWAMVGGADFAETQFNRAIQSRRQVGSTFKPIVYAAAIQSRKVTAASLMADAPIAFATTEDFVWKPSNYSNDYLGNITLRKALALSRNTVTVRVLETTDPGMNHDVVYDFARALGIGGTPTYALPKDFVPSPQNDVLCPWLRETPESTICMDHYPPRTDPDASNTAHRAGLKPTDEHYCRACDYSMALGSASLTMEELLRAYSAFPSGGKLVEPYYVEEVRDRTGKLLEQHAPHEFPQVIEPGVASIATWLLEGVVQEGTGHEARAALGLNGLGGKTGTTNDEKDAWFVGFTPNVITDVWVGYDQPRSLGVSSTGGRTALPIWIDYMKVAAPKDQDRPFAVHGDLDSANIDETTGRRVSSGGRTYPFLPGTVPEATGSEAGQVSLQDLTTEL
jgi:penicillin-binding protein 1A